MRNLSYFYAEDFLNYFEKRFDFQNDSYIIENNEHYFYAPILHKDNQVGSGPLSLLPIPYYKGNKGSRKFKKLMEEYLQKIGDLGAKRIAIRQDPSVENDSNIVKILLVNGFKPNIFYTTLVDLTSPEAALWNNLRKSYRSLINNLRDDSEKTLVKVGSDNIDICFGDWVQLYSALLKRGGKVLSENAFDEIKKSIKNNTGFLYLLYSTDELISGIHVNFYNKIAYYSASGINPKYEEKAAYTHYVIYKAIMDLKECGLEKFEIGPIFYKNVENFYNPSDKELTISDFKLGMGGELTPFIIFLKEDNKYKF